MKMKMKMCKTLVLVALIAVIGLAFVGCDNGSTSNNEVRVVAPEFRGRFVNVQGHDWFELTETTILRQVLYPDHHPAWTVGNVLWIYSWGHESRVGFFSESEYGKRFTGDGGQQGWGAFTRVTD